MMPSKKELAYLITSRSNSQVASFHTIAMIVELKCFRVSETVKS